MAQSSTEAKEDSIPLFMLVGVSQLLTSVCMCKALASMPTKHMYTQTHTPMLQKQTNKKPEVRKRLIDIFLRSQDQMIPAGTEIVTV